MPTPHKYVEVIKAWADGYQIQFRYLYRDDEWRDFAMDNPGWNNAGIEWRVKPEVIKYRRYITKTFGDGGELFVETLVPHQQIPIEELETRPDFIRWIDTEWQMVEV